MGVLSDIVGGITKPLGDWAARREERKALERQLAAQERMKKHELEMARADRMIELQSQGLTADMNWEMEFARQAQASWKDEYTLLVVSVPAVLAFVPGGAPIVAAGFAALATTPLWYQGMLASLFFATVGIRYWRRTQSDT